MDLRLKEKVAIVTGAGRGIGRAIAMTLAAEGAKVAVNDYYLERAETVTDEIKMAGGEAISVQANITKTKQVERMIEKVMKAWDQLNILVNNAGIPAGYRRQSKLFDEKFCRHGSRVLG